MSLSGHYDVVVFERCRQCAESTRESTITKSEPTFKLVNRILGSRLLISNLLGPALRLQVELGKPFMKPCMVSLISKETHLVFLRTKIMVKQESFIY